MKDTYTRVVLTVIAACLLMICFRFYWQPQSVKADQPQAPQEIRIVGIAPDVVVPVAANTSLPVQIQGSSAVLPVGVIAAKSTGIVPVVLRGVGNGVVLHVTTGQQ